MKQEYRELLKKFINLNRVIVSRDMTRMAAELHRQFPELKVISIPSGTECDTWTVPREWNVTRGVVREVRSGRVIVDFRNHPLHVMSYSSSFRGIVAYDELCRHLYFDRANPDSIPYHYVNQYQYREKKWGFCLPYREFRKIKGKSFAVDLRTELKPGALKVLDWHIRGKQPETLLFAAHTCHQGQANDGLVNCVLGLELFAYLSELNRKTGLNKSYRLVLGPEFFGAIGFLARARNLRHIRHGVYLDFMAVDEKFVVGASCSGNGEIDRLLRETFATLGWQCFEHAFRFGAGNDEVFYDNADVGIPMVQLNRCRPDVTYSEYHTSMDSLSAVDERRYRESLHLLQTLVGINDQNLIPVKRYRGIPYFYRYGFDIKRERVPGSKNVCDIILCLLDGKKNVLELAARAGIRFNQAEAFLRRMADKNLIAFP